MVKLLKKQKYVADLFQARHGMTHIGSSENFIAEISIRIFLLLSSYSLRRNINVMRILQ